ncbi:hypothetical protein [Streptomyces sp. NK15101]|uniref:hypothetical protein n=1 Tax=Streptomyces sp. NK15101 TaxID=2873261 RepID=UPI0035A89517
MGESVPVRCPECLRTQAYAAPVFPCACGSPVAPPVLAGAAAEPITHRNWADEWVTVRCGACGHENDWPHPELGCPCGTVLRIPVRPAEPDPVAHRAPVDGSNGTADGVAGTGGPPAPPWEPGPFLSPPPVDPGAPRPRTGNGAGTGGPGANGVRTDGSGAGGAAPGRAGTGHGPEAAVPGANGFAPGTPGTGGAGTTDGTARGASGGAGGADGGRAGSAVPLRGAPSAPGEGGSPWFGPGPRGRGLAGPAGRGADWTGPTGRGAGGLGADGLGADGLGPAGRGADGAGPAGRGADGTGPAGPRTFAERYPARVPLPPTAPRPAPLRGAFRPVTIRTSRDAVAAAAGYLRWLGFRDVVQPEERPASGVDLRAPGLVAQVDPSTRPTGLRAVECLWLNGLSAAAVSVFFSLAGYTPEARSRAAEVGLPLFVLDLTGTPQPVNDAADELTAGGA